MSADSTPPVALDLQFDEKNRLTWKEPLREKAPEASALRVAWNEDAGRYEAYPVGE